MQILSRLFDYSGSQVGYRVIYGGSSGVLPVDAVGLGDSAGKAGSCRDEYIIPKGVGLFDDALGSGYAWMCVKLRQLAGDNRVVVRGDVNPVLSQILNSEGISVENVIRRILFGIQPYELCCVDKLFYFTVYGFCFGIQMSPYGVVVKCLSKVVRNRFPRNRFVLFGDEGDLAVSAVHKLRVGFVWLGLYCGDPVDSGSGCLVYEIYRLKSAVLQWLGSALQQFGLSGISGITPGIFCDLLSSLNKGMSGAAILMLLVYCGEDYMLSSWLDAMDRYFGINCDFWFCRYIKYLIGCRMSRSGICVL